jgi:hypothetical protein
MVSDGTEGVRRLPDEAFASHARRPDPSRDEHVAFPEPSLPLSAWAPVPVEPYEFRARYRPGITLYRRGHPWRFIPFDPKPHRGPRGPRGSRGRRGRAKRWIAALVLGAFLYSCASQAAVHVTGDSIELEAGAPGLVGSPVEIREVVPNDLAPIQPMDQQLHELSSRPSSVRIEVVATDDTNASVNVATGSGDGNVINIPLPYAADVRFDGELTRLWVTVSPNVEHATVQCRVYADGALVAIDTEVGLVECVADAVRRG